MIWFHMETEMEPFLKGPLMINFTIKNMSDELHKKLKERAKLHNRSMNREILSTLEYAATVPYKIDIDETLKKTDKIREKNEIYVTEKEMNKFKKWGRA